MLGPDSTEKSQTSVRVVFMGTPAIAVPVLSALLEHGREVAAVYTQPDRPRGRGKGVAPTPVARFARDRTLPVLQPASLRSASVHQELAALAPDLIVVAAYGLFLPRSTLELPALGCLNVHPSLLPRYRGPSPVASAILAGEATTGVSIIRLDEGMDSGPIVAVRETVIGQRENAEDLTGRLFELGASLLIDTLPGWARGEIQAEPQEEANATVTRLLTRDDGQIDWEHPALEIDRHVRAYCPWPGSFTRWKGKLLKIVEASVYTEPDSTPPLPGLVVSLPNGVFGIATGDGVLQVQRLQLEGRRAVGADEFALGYPEFVGSGVS